ncbi:MAG: NADH-quinone oxidoreductase subunit M [Chloroflexi bacterium]|nr:NADH-quinone oxidoreductase subunit M [Chloroflexota bacterium]
MALCARSDRQARWMAAAFSIATLVLSLIVWARLDLGIDGPQFVQRNEWIKAFNVEYFIGVDGLSAPLVTLTALSAVAGVFISWHVHKRVKEFFFWLLLLESGILGVFVSLDMLLFFLFWEVELIPMYMLISIWGSGRKEYSAIKFVLFTMAASALMLAGILAIYFSTSTFDMMALRDGPFEMSLIPASLAFFMLFAAFAVKLPIWPFHTWLPDAHTDAPTAGSVMLAGVMLKMGGYGILRLCVSFFPDVAHDYAWLLATLAVVNVLYGGLMVFRQKDLKRLIAYSSVSHMGFVLLGIASLGEVGLNGAALQMFTHGTITGLLFMLAGTIYEKARTRHIPDLGGLANKTPLLALGFILGGLASLGLPAMSGFVAELTVFLGAFGVYRIATILAIFGIVLSAGYILWTVQRVFFGPEKPRFATTPDADAMEIVPMVGLLAAIFIVGIYPALVTDTFKVGIAPIVNLLGGGA